MAIGMIDLTTVAGQRISAFVKRPQRGKTKLQLALVEVGDVCLESPTDANLLVRFPGPWLGLCGYLPEQIDYWPVISLFGARISIHPKLPSRLRNRVIDEKTVCDPVSGLSYTGLYLRKR